jgi:PAS domain S-box-containing protein
MKDFFTRFFSPDSIAHSSFVRYFDFIGLYSTFDTLTAVSYIVIGLLLITLIYRRRDLDFPALYILLGLCLVTSGLTRGLAVWSIRHPAFFPLEGVSRGLGALISAAAAILVIKLAPQAMSLPSPRELRAEILERERAERQVRRLNEELENRVLERTGALKLANSLLAESERRRSLALEAAGMGTWFWDTQLEVAWLWDERCKALFGISQDEPITYARYLGLVDPEDRPSVASAIQEALQHDSDFDAEYRVVWPDGSKHWLHTKGSVETRSSGGSRTMQGITTDVSERKQMEADALRLAAIVESSDDAILSEDFSGAVTSWNRGAQALFGYSAEQVIGKHISILNPPGRPDETTDMLSRIQRGERIESFETLLCHENGNEVSISMTVSPMFDAEESTVGASIIARDISDRKRLDQALSASEQRFRTLAEAVPDMLFTAADDGTLTYLSARFQEYAGTAESDVQQPGIWKRLIHPDDFYRQISLWKQSLRTGQPFENECRIRRLDGLFRWFVTRATPMRGESGESVQWLGACTDIDHLKRTETALRYSNDELRQFAYAAAHDLQEPLRNIVNSAELLRQVYGLQLDEEAEELIRICIEGGARMHGMVKDLLAYSKVIDPNESDSVLSDSGQVLSQALANLGTAISESGAKVMYRSLPAVPAQKTHLLQLFQNLIGNALKYRKSDVPPVIGISANREGDQWVFAVTDNGIGFNPAYAEKIFGVFKRLHHRHEYPGNGIGLAICARIVAHYGGRIWAEGQSGVGATFRFTVPAQEDASCNKQLA